MKFKGLFFLIELPDQGKVSLALFQGSTSAFQRFFFFYSGIASSLWVSSLQAHL